MSDNHYDYFVIGAGSGGVRSARIAAGYGAKVGIAESGALGGTCVNVGCVPKKIFVYAADYGFGFEDAKGFGWSGENIRFDWQKLIERKNNEINNINVFYDKLLKDSGVTLHKGFANFVDAHRIDIGGEEITADKILIATGGRPRAASIPGAEFIKNSDDMFFLEGLPSSALIIGGGYIAVEFAHILSGLGVKTTLAYRGALFLRGFDEEIRHALAKEMRAQGIDLRFNCDITSVEKSDDALKAQGSDGSIIEADLVMAAIGRDANTAQLNLEAAGVKVEPSGRIAINETYQSNVPHIYALGDIANDHNLTPVAIREGHVLADQLFGGKPESSVNYENIATAIFSNPPIGTVGLDEAHAKEAGYDIHVYKSEFTAMRHKLSGRGEKSLVKLIVDTKTDRVLGAHMLGVDAPEIMQGFAVAMNMGATKEDFDRTMAMHPTAAEEFVTLR